MIFSLKIEFETQIHALFDDPFERYLGKFKYSDFFRSDLLGKIYSQLTLVKKSTTAMH